MTASPQELALMQSIREKYHPAIAEAVSGTNIPPEFLAALVAGESGGNPNAKRFEPHILLQLWEVLLGRSPRFGSIGRLDISSFITDGQEFPGGPILADGGYVRMAGTVGRLDAAATSWGLTQIMGYQAIALGVPLAVLQTVPGNLSSAVRMLQQFEKVFKPMPGACFSEMFTCWNTGHPRGVTADPAYAANGAERMDLYRDLLEEPPKAVSA